MTAVLEVPVHTLRAEPRTFDGVRVRFRDIVHHRFEGMSAAGAWWTKTGGDIYAEGAYLADVQGIWSSRTSPYPGGHGHMGMWPAEICGTAHRVSFDAPKAIEEVDLAACEELTPLTATGTVRAMMQGFVWEGLELTRLGEDCRMPNVERPYGQSIDAVFCRDGGRLYIAAFELVGAPRPLAPRRVEPTDLAAARGGEYIEVEGELAFGGFYDFPVSDRSPQCVNWPRLEGALDVVIPEIATTANRHVGPNVTSPGMARWLALLEGGPRRVRAIGEVRVPRGGPGRAPCPQLWATALDVV